MHLRLDSIDSWPVCTGDGASNRGTVFCGNVLVSIKAGNVGGVLVAGGQLQPNRELLSSTTPVTAPVALESGKHCCLEATTDAFLAVRRDRSLNLLSAQLKSSIGGDSDDRMHRSEANVTHDASRRRVAGRYRAGGACVRRR